MDRNDERWPGVPQKRAPLKEECMEITQDAGDTVKSIEINIVPPAEFLDYVKRLAENLMKSGYLLKNFHFDLDYLYDDGQEEGMVLPEPRTTNASYKFFTKGNQWS
jgi:hypothetical protein